MLDRMSLQRQGTEHGAGMVDWEMEAKADWEMEAKVDWKMEAEVDERRKKDLVQSSPRNVWRNCRCGVVVGCE